MPLAMCYRNFNNTFVDWTIRWMFDGWLETRSEDLIGHGEGVSEAGSKSTVLGIVGTCVVKPLPMGLRLLPTTPTTPFQLAFDAPER